MSHFMREKFGDGVPIDIYEKTAIGGRMATVELAGDEYESGGSIIHPANEYMVNFTQMLGESIVNERDIVINPEKHTVCTCREKVPQSLP